MTERTAEIAITLKLDVADRVGDDLLRRYIDKSIDNGFDLGLGANIGVTVTEQQVDIRI